MKACALSSVESACLNGRDDQMLHLPAVILNFRRENSTSPSQLFPSLRTQGLQPLEVFGNGCKCDLLT